MTNQTFNFNRYALTLNKELVENRKQLLIIVLCLFLGLTILMFLGNWAFQNSGKSVSGMRALANFVVMTTFGFMLSIMASLSFNGLKGKCERVTHMMSPASAFEKFLAQITIYFVGGVLSFFVCAQLADLARIGLMHLLVGGHNILPPINFVTGIFCIGPDSMSMPEEIGAGISPWIVATSFMLSFAMYMLGAVLWPKLSFLKTFAALSILQMALGMVTVIVFAMNDMDSVIHFIKRHIYDFVAVMPVVYVVFTAVCIVLAFWLYKRKDVIKNSWL